MVKDCLVGGVTTSIVGNQMLLSGLEIVGFARQLNTSASQQPPVITEPPLSRETQQEFVEGTFDMLKREKILRRSRAYSTFLQEEQDTSLYSDASLDL
jgi:hypothetical protein